MHRYTIICKRLESLGYKNFLSPDSLPLLEEIIIDLITLKELNEQYKKMNEKLEREKRNLEKALEPYQQDNGRLILENNDLQNKLYNLEQRQEKELKEFKKKIKEKDIHTADLEFILNQTLQKVKELDKELFDKNIRISNLVANKSFYKFQDETKISKIPNYSYFGIISDNKNTENINVSSKPELGNVNVKSKLDNMEKRIDELLEEIEELKLDNHHQSDIIAALKCQVNQKDREIGRLKNVLSGGRPLSAVSRDFCTYCSQKEFKIKSLEAELEEAVEKQHEAMSRALQLVEKNQLLERELHDIDHIALAVEEECQNKVKHNIKNVQILQEKLRQKCEEMKKLDDLVSNMKKKIEKDELELESLKKEKESLEKNLQIVSGEKKALNDKINHFLSMEKNLNSKVASLQELNKSLQRQIGDMEERVSDVLGTKYNPVTKVKPKKYNSALGPAVSKIHSSVNIGAKKSSSCKKSSSEELNIEDPLYVTSSLSLLDRVQNERDFYHNECHRLKDQLCFDNKPLLMKQQELEKEVADLKQSNFMLRHENSILLKRLEYSEHVSCSSGDSIKIIVDKLEKERDMALSDISRLQGERDALKERIKIATECQVGEQSRFEKIIRESEDRIRRLESERRELINSQSSQRIALSNMEEKCDEFKEKTRKAQNELAQMTANYNQLKTLQEQTDRTLSDVQSRHTQVDIELIASNTKIMDLQRSNFSLENEISQLKKEKASLIANLTFIEKEKDGLLITLDEKTEKVAKLEAQIKKQDECIREFNEKNVHLEKKIEFTLNEKTNREFGLRSLEREIEHFKEELQQCERQKECLIRENRRLQDDLSSAAKDCLTARRDLDVEKEEVENLKKQLQQYISEVKKAEELLTKKESERNQMLEHFRSLSIEATALESNNHTLESTVENTKSQLNSANNKIMDLERQLEARDTLLFNYEKQISELTAQIAELETKLKISTESKIRAEEDLAALRDLCSSLDGQKEALRKQANSFDAEKIHLANEVRRLSEEYEGLNQKLNHERTVSQTLEKSLSNSRQETLEHKITNKDLQSHIQYLREKVDELTQKLETESQDVRRYQTQCADLSQQVSELRREVTNARFERAKAMEDSRRNLLESCQCEEEAKEISFEEKSNNDSLRNIPPLTFQGDSDRTESLESEPDYLKFVFGEPGKTYRKPCILSPLLEKFEGAVKEKEDTASELSSLPEDSRSKVVDLPYVEGKSNETSARLTYSVRNRYLCDALHFDAEQNIVEDRNSDMQRTSDQKFCPMANKPGTDLFDQKYRDLLVDVENYPPDLYLDEDNKTCSECEFQKYIWEESSQPIEDALSIIRSLSPLPPPESTEGSGLDDLGRSEQQHNNRSLSDVDENTFSVSSFDTKRRLSIIPTLAGIERPGASKQGQEVARGLAGPEHVRF